MSDLLEQHLLTRSLYEPSKDLEAEILADDAKLASIAGLAGQEAALTLLISARISKLRDYLVFKAMPVEVTVYRQAMHELSTLLDDLAAYAKEYEARKAGATALPQSAESTMDNGTG